MTLVSEPPPPATASWLPDSIATFRERLARIPAAPLLRIDLGARTVTVDEHDIHLTSREFELLAHLARADGRPVTRDELLASVWAHTPVREGSRTIDVHVRRIRDKLSIGHVITTVRGVGYRFATSAEVALIT
jgi:DNA-binding response OmpR family regulator